MTIYSVIQRPMPHQNLNWLPEGAITAQKQGFTLVELPNGVEMPEPPPNVMVMEGYPALDQMGAMATLLAVTGAVPLQDAANIAKRDPAHLVAEAEAWAAVAEGVTTKVVSRGRRMPPVRR